MKLYQRNLFDDLTENIILTFETWGVRNVFELHKIFIIQKMFKINNIG